MEHITFQDRITTCYEHDNSSVLLNCLVEDEAKQVMDDFHRGDCGGHLFWKTIAKKVLREGYYWLTLFLVLYKTVTSYHECQVFQGKRKLLPLLLKLIVVNVPFQQWGLNFIGEINPTSSAQHRWILTTTDYVTVEIL